MICKIIKWFLGWTGGEVPAVFAKHLSSCKGCSDYAVFLKSLPVDFKESLDSELGSVPINFPRNPGEMRVSNSLKVKGKIRRNWGVGLAAASLVGLIVLSVPEGDGIVDKPVYKGDLLGEFVPGKIISYAAAELESPIEREFVELKKAVMSSQKFLRNSLKIKKKDTAG